ncbi:MAG: DUF421 domain-containing protein [Clostridium sp.]|uniref:DUF421 domain-containing protein n=1 Tax=Clostridium sp. TaxID=1506 RepID=UPI003F3824BC
MFVVCIRTTILYILVVLVMRLMGKRQVGELQPYEFVITIMISDLASLPMQDSRLPLLLGIIPILTLLFLKILLSQLQLKCQFARRVVEGEPSILIYKSKINYNSLKSQQINIDELMEEMRLSGYFNLDEINYAILETNGHISFLPMDNSSSVSKESTQKKDNSKSNELQLPKILVSDGKINKNPLTKVNNDKDWIYKQLQNHGVDDIKKVLIAMYDTNGKFKIQLYDKYSKEQK